MAIIVNFFRLQLGLSFVYTMELNLVLIILRCGGKFYSPGRSLDDALYSPCVHSVSKKFQP